MFSEGIQAGEERRRSRGWGRGGGQGVTQGPASPFPGIWESVVVGGVVFQLPVHSEGAGFGSDAAPGELGVSGLRLSGYAFSLKLSSWSREEPADQGPALQKKWPQDAEPVGFQGFLPATGILIGLQIDYLETKGEIFHGNFAGPKTPDPQRS